MTNQSLLIGLRGAFGVVAWGAPHVVLRTMGLSPSSRSALPFVLQLVGVRDLALAAGLALGGEQNRRLWLQLGLLCDAGDAAAAILAGRRGELSTFTTVSSAGAALGGVALGAATLTREAV